MLKIECEYLEVQPGELERELEYRVRKGECEKKLNLVPRGYVAIGAPPCSSLWSRHSTVMIMYIFSGDESQ